MRKSIYTLAITGLIAGSMLTACQTPAKKDDAAVSTVQNLKEQKNEAIKENQEAASAAEWKAFRDESEIKIADNETRITELRGKMQKPGKMLDPMYKSRIDALEARNKNLRDRMDAYEKNQSDWEAFKREYNHDMDGLGKALKDFTVDNKD